MKYTLFWFRRDLRREDNVGLRKAMQTENLVMPLFIFDPTITDKLPVDDHRVSFIYDTLECMDAVAREQGSSLLVRRGVPEEVFASLLDEYDIETVITNRDYEPSAIQRDDAVRTLCHERGVLFETYKDQVIFEQDEILSKTKMPYRVFTPYKKMWLSTYHQSDHQPVLSENCLDRLWKEQLPFPSRESLGQLVSEKKVVPYTFDHIYQYDVVRDDPAADQTTYLSPYLRFGLVSLRRLVIRAQHKNHNVFLSELIWREFFMQILWHWPHTVEHPFQEDMIAMPWRESEDDFARRVAGETGYPIVDAGMKQLAQTGYMHNRVRMIVASFLTKHLLIHRKRGERYFAEQLFDYELSSNVGNRQRAASTGVDAVPYFRVFNPWTQQKRFDKEGEYICRWVPDYDPENPDSYITPMVDHKEARERVLSTFKDVKARG